MFSLISLYKDYANQSTQSLIELIESELFGYNTGPGYINLVKTLKDCISFTSQYTNSHQKNTDPEHMNDKGEHIRRSGEPYINHSLRVALILIHERLFDEDVLKAAIMHDLFEDTDFTYEQAKERFNVEIADLIDCVTNVSESEDNQTKKRCTLKKTGGTASVDESKPFTNTATDGLTQAEVDYSATIMKCNEHRMAFYIKFADRLDNLMTLDAMPIDKQKQKIEDTEYYLYPLLKKLKASRFLKYFDNAIFKVKQSWEKTPQPNMFNVINKKLSEFKAMPSVLSTFKNVKNTLNKLFYDIRLIRPTVYEIYKHLKTANIKIKSFSQSDIVYDIYLISQAKTPRLSEILNEFTVAPLNNYSVESVGTDDFLFMDDLRNHFRVCLITNNDFNRQHYGDSDATLIIATPNKIYDKLVAEEMTVFTSDHVKITIPVGSTVIDYAFYYNSNLAEHMIGALINGRNVPLYTRLHNEDVIELIIGDYPKAEISLDWIAQCETRNAKLELCKLVKKQINDLVEKINALENNN